MIGTSVESVSINEDILKAFMRTKAVESLAGAILYTGIFEFVQRADILGNIVNQLPVIGPVRQQVLEPSTLNPKPFHRPSQAAGPSTLDFESDGECHRPPSGSGFRVWGEYQILSIIRRLDIVVGTLTVPVETLTTLYPHRIGGNFIPESRANHECVLRESQAMLEDSSTLPAT
jgi:hypothetical protein